VKDVYKQFPCQNESGSVEWVEKCHKLTSELEWLRDTAQKLSEENKTVNKELRKLKRILKQKEEDREYLIKQLVSAKKENATLSSVRHKASNPIPPALARLERPFASAKGSQTSIPSLTRRESDIKFEESALVRRIKPLEVLHKFSFQKAQSARHITGPKMASISSEKEKRYRSLVKKLNRQLEVEASKVKKLKSARQAEVCFQDCIKINND